MTADQTPYHVDIHDTCEIIRVDQERVSAAVAAALRHCGIMAGTIGIAVVDDKEIARIHESFLGDPSPTDVITFDLRDDSASDTLEGEIVTSAETAKRIADAQGRDSFAELLLYVVHGCLHLAGYDDQQPADRIRMHETENAILTALGYGAVYGEVRS